MSAGWYVLIGWLVLYPITVRVVFVWWRLTGRARWPSLDTLYDDRWFALIFGLFTPWSLLIAAFFWFTQNPSGRKRPRFKFLDRLPLFREPK